MIRSTLISAAFTSFAALPALAFTAENDVKVLPVTGGFEVYDTSGYGARGLWCAASDYAKRVLGAQNTDRLFVKSEIAPGANQPERKAVVFTMDPQGLTPASVPTLAPSIRSPGANLAVFQAYVYCADHRLTKTR